MLILPLCSNLILERDEFQKEELGRLHRSSSRTQVLIKSGFVHRSVASLAAGDETLCAGLRFAF